MGLFSKKKTNEYEKENSKLNETVKTAKEKIIMKQLSDSDSEAAELVDKLKEGNPLIINFDALDIMPLNKMLAFLTGACYCLGGKIIRINETTYLFARKEEFLDGTLMEFINNL